MLRLFLITLLFIFDASAKDAVPALEGPGVSNAGLSAVLKNRLIGLPLEAKRSVEIKTLQDQAREFVKFKQGRLSNKNRLSYFADCIADKGENPFCRFVLPKDNRKPEEEDSKDSIQKISEYILEAKVEKLSQTKETKIQKALRTFPKWEGLQKLTEVLLSSSTCPSVQLLTSLGLKAEEFLPVQEFKRIAVSLYDKVDECFDAETGDKARYRSALIKIWNSECSKAEPLLMKLSERKGSDYVSRAIFWRQQCAKKAGNTYMASVLKDRLTKEFPLAYHALLLTKGNSLERSLAKVPQEPNVSFRSENNYDINNQLRAIEVLQMIKAEGLIPELLQSISERVSKEEPSLRLYVACLAVRFRENIELFKILSGIFQEEPTLITRRTLELFYPLRRLDDLKRYGSRVDPFLVAAIIRQESGFSERARSTAGALGLMQVMPATARTIERVSKRELYDAKTNIRLGTKYFQRLLKKYRNDVELALAAYNAGPERVDEWQRRYPVSYRPLFLDLIPFKETRDYVALISRNYYWYLSLYSASESKALMENYLNAFSAL